MITPFDVISINIPIIIKEIDNASNKSEVLEIPIIVLLNATPKAKTHIPNSSQKRKAINF